MLRKLVLTILTILVSLAAGAPQASARPLKLDEIHALGTWLECTESCPTVSRGSPYEDFVRREACVVACGVPPRLWEKNGIAPVDRVDLDLALLEYNHAQDPTRELICYGDDDETVVVPGALCAGQVCEAAPDCTNAECAASNDIELECTDDQPGGPRCVWPSQRRSVWCPEVVCDARPVRSFQECADGDGDGVPLWLERHLGLDDGVVESRCGPSNACAFNEICAYQPNIAAGLCQPRDCGGPCTAFHMEVVAQDDVEVLIHIHYDFSPIPARALDLYVTYDRTSVTLADARPLTPLALQGKQLATTHLSDGTLRLSVLDVTATHPVPTGPIIELVFRRTANAPTTIGFATDDLLQLASVAPLQGNQSGQQQLTDDALWGNPIELAPRDEAPTRLRYWFGFDSLASPLSYANIPSAEDLCERYALCANESDDVERAKFLNRLEALQAGRMQATRTIEGVTAGAAFFDGSHDHLRLPITYERPLASEFQSFSFSTWFFTEGNSTNELKTTPQILYSHNGYNERTRFGLQTVANPDGGIDLRFFDGDLLSTNPRPTIATLAARLAPATWHHVGFTFDANASRIEFYFDGQRVGDYVFPRAPAFVCPQFFGGRDVQQHVEGNVLGGRPPEYIYHAARRSNLDAIERMDIGGLGSTTVIGDRQFAYRDPDYHPTLDRLLFASNASGSFEIWMARGDGSDARQVTVGFGDAARGIAARRPRWSPDGSAFVFESNVFDILAQDNAFKRVSHLYFVNFDPLADEVAIELPSGSVVDQLEYPSLVASGLIGTFRVTRAVQDRNHRNAVWLKGLDRDRSLRGELVMETSDPTLDGRQIYSLVIPEVLELSTSEPITGLGESTHELSLLAAHRSEKAGLVPIVTERVFYERAYAIYETTDDFTINMSPDGDDVIASVSYAPQINDANCWDRNRNRVRDSDEDRNADGIWDTADCLDHEVRNLFVEYDASLFNPVLEDDDGNPLEPGAVTVAQDKGLRLKTAEPFGRSFVRVEITSPLDASPLVPGEIARLRFVRVAAGSPVVPFAPYARRAQSELLVKDLNSLAPPTAFESHGIFEQADDAAFSPDGNKLVIAAFSRSRPVLLRTQNLLGADQAESLFVQPTRLNGIDWVQSADFYACNWVGGTLHLQNKQIIGSLRGGLDDLKVHAGLRDPDSFRSESERGFEILVREGRAGELPLSFPTCGNSHSECPAYHLCVDQRCVAIPCDPEDPYACSAHEAHCSLRPTAIEQEHAGSGGSRDAFDWVCAADCNVDAQCFTQQCLNGPCRFCEQTDHACIECREVVRELGALTISTIEGCPDTKSFQCVAGACVTECYAFQDGQSQYLCDPLLEYCNQGRCVMHDWTWWDIAPATFSGAADTFYDVAPEPLNGWPGYSVAVDQRVPISINAYGVTDYGQAPEVVVEVRGGPFYGATWSRIARVLVHNRTRVEANANPYRVSSPHPFNDMRLRLITAPYNNLSGGASGLGERDDAFCLGDFAATAAAAGENTAVPAACYNRGQGSRFNLGYGADVTARAAIQHCRGRGHAGCPASSDSEHDFLRGGHPAVVVLEATAAGGSVMNNVTSNLVCSYEGGQTPVGAGNAPKKLFYGDITREISPERDVFCTNNPGACLDAGGLVEFDRDTYGHGLLNCNVFDPTERTHAAMTFQNVVLVRDFPLTAGPILETANNCTVDIDAFRVEPCYTWIGGGGSVDPYNDAVTIGASFAFGTFDFGNFTSFAHNEGYQPVDLPRRALSFAVTGHDGSGLVVGFRNSAGGIVETIPVPSGTTPVTVNSSDTYAVGRIWRAFIAEQPTTPDLICAIAPDTREGTISPDGATVAVTCVRSHRVRATVQGVSGSLVLTNTWTTAGGGGVEDLAISVDGTSSFGQALPPGTAWQVRIKRQPAGQKCTLALASGTMAAVDSNFTVDCRDIAMSELRMNVTGLVGAGATFIERVTGRVLTPTGIGTFAFPGRFAEDTNYEIGVLTLPDDPPQLCRPSTGGATLAGQMSTNDRFAGSFVCTVLPSYSVGGTVSGLRGVGLRLSLNDQWTVTVSPPATPGQIVSFAFPRRLISATAVGMRILAQPEGPPQTCQVLLGTGLVEGEDITNLTVACGPRSASSNAFYLGGTVEGLRGSGLRVGLRDRTQFVDVGADGAFQFESPLGSFSDYDVIVDRQPGSPTQFCAVVGGAGRIEDRNVDSVRIVCRDAIRVTVDIRSPAAEGANVRAVLVETTGQRRLVAVSPASARVQNGQAFFAMRTPVVDGDGPDASLEPGEYRLYVFVNDDLSFDSVTGQPSYNAGGDRGAIVFVTGTPDRPPRILIEDAGLAPLLQGPVISAISAGFADRSDMRCWFTPGGSGRLDTPMALDAPILGTASRTCSNAQTCPEGRVVATGYQIATMFQTALPAGLAYDVTCRVTTDGVQRVGHLVGVNVTSPLFIEF